MITKTDSARTSSLEPLNEMLLTPPSLFEIQIRFIRYFFSIIISWINFIQENSLPNKPKPIAEVFTSASNLGRLNQHINQIKQFEDRLRKILPSPVSEDYSWSVGNFRDRHLTLFVKNPGQASKLRFQQLIFLEKIQSILPDIETISIKVLYQGEEIKSDIKEKRNLSLEAAESISESAKHISDGELRAALQRLSQQTGKG